MLSSISLSLPSSPFYHSFFLCEGGIIWLSLNTVCLHTWQYIIYTYLPPHPCPSPSSVREKGENLAFPGAVCLCLSAPSPLFLPHPHPSLLLPLVCSIIWSVWSQQSEHESEVSSHSPTDPPYLRLKVCYTILRNYCITTVLILTVKTTDVVHTH